MKTVSASRKNTRPKSVKHARSPVSVPKLNSGRCEFVGNKLDNTVCKPCQGLTPLYECEIYGACSATPSKHLLKESDRLLPINLARWDGIGHQTNMPPQSCQVCPLHSSNRPSFQPITVAVIFHNYGGFLSEVMESLAWQTTQPYEVLLIDSGSTDDTLQKLESFALNPTNFGFFQGDLPSKETPAGSFFSQRISRRVKYRVVSKPSGNLWDARKLAFDESDPKTLFLCCLDADDLLPPNYLKNVMQVFSEIPHCGVVRGDHQCFGNETRRESYGYHPKYIESGDLYRYNAIPGSGSVIRKEAILDTRPFDDIPPESIDHTKCHEDWLLFKRILKHGWKLGSVSSSPILYRKHDSSLLGKVLKSHPARRISPEHAGITIVVPCSDRSYKKDVFRWLDTQPRHKNTHLLLLDCRSDKNSYLTSYYPSLDDLTRRYQSVQIASVGLPDSNPDSDRHDHQEGLRTERRMARIYNHLHGRLSAAITEFTFILEDDIRPPLNALEILLSKFEPDVDVVAGVYPSRWQKGGWHAEFIPEHALTKEDRRLEAPTYDCPYGLAGIGCAMLRTSLLTESPAPFRTYLDSNPISGWNDVQFWQLSRERRPHSRHLVTWEVECGHANLKASWE